MTRLWVLSAGVAAGVLAVGVLRNEAVAERVLSLLRERLDDVGDSGACAEAMVLGSVLVLIRPPLSLALRRRARSFCSVKKLGRAAGRLSGGGGGVAGRLEDRMLTGGSGPCVQRAACRMQRDIYRPHLRSANCCSSECTSCSRRACFHVCSME